MVILLNRENHYCSFKLDHQRMMHRFLELIKNYLRMLLKVDRIFILVVQRVSMLVFLSNVAV